MQVQVLPDPPGAINHTVVEPESRVTGADEDITGRITAHGVVTATVDADVAAAGDTLHVHLEVVDVVVAQDQVHDRGEVGVILDDLGGQIALQAARVVGEGVLAGLAAAAGEHQGDGAQVDGVVLEGAAGHAAAAVAGGQVDDRVVAQTQLDVAGGRDGGAVSGHRGVAAVEDLGCLQVAGVSGPVPVAVVMLDIGNFFYFLLCDAIDLRVVAGVATLVAHGFLEVVDEVPVPREEGSGEVNLQSLVDVGCDKVIVTRPRTRDLRGRSQRRQLLQAKDGADVGLLLGARESPPIATDAQIAQGTSTTLGNVRVARDSIDGGVVRQPSQVRKL